MSSGSLSKVKYWTTIHLNLSVVEQIYNQDSVAAYRVYDQLEQS